MKTKNPELYKLTTYSTSVGALGLFLFLLFSPGLKPFSAFSEETEGREKQEIRSDSPETPKIPYSEKELLKTGRPAPYRDEQLREIAFPLGGIGTGAISLGGRGELRDWEIFNRPGKGINLPFTFFAIYGEDDGKKFSRLLEAQLFPPYRGGHGLPRERVPGLPRFQKAVFRAEYPVAEVELSDPSLPVVVTLEAFNPFIPGDAENSGLPVAVLKYRVKNITDKALKITLAGSLANPVGFDGEGALNSVYHREFGQNVNRLIKGPVSGLYFYSRKVSPDSPAFGTLALATTWPDLTYVTHWVRGEWGDDLQILWDDFSDDGQLGRLICLYRDWQISGDLNFLKRLWPQAKKALEYAWAAWDKDRDGLLEDEQHNTYDIEFFGPNSMVSSFYLGALKAAAKIALALGEGKAAAEYERVFQLGQKNFDHLLWNGEYYVQNYEKALEKKYQYGEGCLADQLLGQWLSMVAGVGRLLDETRVVKALEAIYRYNFRENFHEFSNAQRTYALADEKGLLLCTWPQGGRPPLPFPYSDEVWTGIEYQVASHLLSEGKIREGLTLVRAARERYDDRRRNPWNEVECGYHYARAMSSWALLLALSGFEYSLPEGRIGFDPLLNQDDFQVFWSLGPGWGIYGQKLESRSFVATLRVEYGQLPVREIFLELPEDLGSKKILRVEGEISGKKVRIKWKRQGRKIKVSLPTTLTVLAGRELSLGITT